MAFPARLFDLALMRFAINPNGGDVFLDQPNVLSTYREITQVDDTDQLQLKRGFDILANHVDVLPGSTNAKRDRIQQGVSDTVAESIVHSKHRSGDSNASELLLQADATATTWRLVRSANRDSLQQLKLPEKTQELIERDLRDGFDVFVPDTAASTDRLARIGWYRCDAQGNTLGMMDDGTGGNTEYVVLLKTVVYFNWILINAFSYAYCRSGGGTQYDCLVCLFGVAMMSLIVMEAGVVAAGTGAIVNGPITLISFLCE